MSTATAPSLPTGHEPSPAPYERALFSRLAASMGRHRRSVMLVWFLITIAAAPLALSLTGSLSGAGWDAKGSTAQRVRAELRRDFSALGAENPVVVYHQSTPITSDRSGVKALVSALAAGPKVISVADPLSMPPDAGLISRDGLTALVPVQQKISVDADRPVAAASSGPTFAASRREPAPAPR